MLSTLSPASILAVGDIHGCDRALEVLLSTLLPLPNKVVFLGDYVDRGPSSPRVIGLLAMAKMSRPDWIFLLGNHEVMMMDEFEYNFAPMGDSSGYEQYQTLGGLPKSHRDFLDGLELYWESKSFIFVHGGIEDHADLPIDGHSVNELLWSYSIDEQWKGKTLVRGHFAVETPAQHSNYINMDTGCVFEGTLSAGVLDDQSGKLVGYIQIDKSGSAIRYVSEI